MITFSAYLFACKIQHWSQSPSFCMEKALRLFFYSYSTSAFVWLCCSYALFNVTGFRLIVATKWVKKKTIKAYICDKRNWSHLYADLCLLLYFAPSLFRSMLRHSHFFPSHSRRTDNTRHKRQICTWDAAWFVVCACAICCENENEERENVRELIIMWNEKYTVELGHQVTYVLYTQVFWLQCRYRKGKQTHYLSV